MRFNIPDPKDVYAWHRWFAWYTVTIDNQRVWLETVLRRVDTRYSDEYGPAWEYTTVIYPET